MTNKILQYQKLLKINVYCHGTIVLIWLTPGNMTKKKKRKKFISVLILSPYGQTTQQKEKSIIDVFFSMEESIMYTEWEQ